MMDFLRRRGFPHGLLFILLMILIVSPACSPEAEITSEPAFSTEDLQELRATITTVVGPALTLVAETPIPQTGGTPGLLLATPGGTPPVDGIQTGLSCSPPAAITPENTEGPYYKSGSPETTTLLQPGMRGTPLRLTGYVLNSDCEPVSGAWLDFWQADAGGAYDIGGFSLRGHQFTAPDGSFTLETVIPGEYPGRPPHIHVKVRPPGGDTLTTQLYFPDQSGNQSDGFFLQELVVALVETPEGSQGSYNFIVSAP